ncbi:MAG TPA: bifunctional 2-keto-4-hydroxyglutarate aldolase/2-keto-3-deoxy-6-phosphogluconate aldolase [Candidatus Avimonoglobus intestinipullorum]|uniref:Bifunctional 2-keto-4-hydroxyglutarate aldolase/2-keto-3-deoxy-6-phosphogluconate aldolase n=1 Tax=Candidatus Avimonoglobus intestinipullorum TaxID=2840699 RepID=A0A9D1S643_9FIRM|nr:bifunctional 2-keto-4-hydroxyglutarate aldolase/2-keto-3-deoxy-6-phosphogluconate aldolase [Candidatus Avimonoglobus intestinipullorum]
MEKQQVLTKMTDAGLVAVVRANTADEAIRIADACLEGGCPSIELTFTVPGAHKVIEALANKYTNGEMLLGAGTVLDAETARTAILSGANYIVSPGFNRGAAELCNRYRVPYLPGCMTITEVLTAMEAGADICKIFPADLFGPTIIKDIKGPLPQAKLMPTGGVDVSNVDKWIKAGAVAVGAGSSLTKGAKTGDYAQITATAKEFIAKIKEARA